MVVDNITRLIDAISRLLGTVIWPTLILFLVVRYKSAFASFFQTVSEFSIKGGGVEASGKRQIADAKEALILAAVAQSGPDTSPQDRASEVTAAAKAVESITPRTLRRARIAKVLWVDDRPTNNVQERRALEALGIGVDLSTSTDDAIAILHKQKFDVIISDMGRPPDPRAGYTLLDKVRASGNATPLVFYASSRAPEHIAESRRRGAMGCTNRPDELLEYVLSAIGRGD